MMAEDIQHNQKANFNGLTKSAKSGASKKLTIKNFKGEMNTKLQPQLVHKRSVMNHMSVCQNIVNFLHSTVV